MRSNAAGCAACIEHICVDNHADNGQPIFDLGPEQHHRDNGALIGAAGDAEL